MPICISPLSHSKRNLARKGHQVVKKLDNMFSSFTQIMNVDEQMHRFSLQQHHIVEIIRSEILTAILLQHKHWLEDHFYYLTSWQQADEQLSLPFHSRSFLHTNHVTTQTVLHRVC